jgi:hypothetical protein
MSEQQLEILRQLNAAFNAGEDWPRFYDEEVELAMPVEWPDESVYHGKEGLGEALRQWREGFDEYHWREERLIDASDCVVGLYYHRGRIKQGGPWIDQAIGCVFRFRGEKIIHLDGFFSWREALESAGIEGSDA